LSLQYSYTFQVLLKLSLRIINTPKETCRLAERYQHLRGTHYHHLEKEGQRRKSSSTLREMK
jgi:hypothetical protein